LLTPQIQPPVYGFDDKSKPYVDLWSSNLCQSKGEGWIKVIIPSQEHIEIGNYNYNWIIVIFNISSNNWTGLGTDNVTSNPDADIYD